MDILPKELAAYNNDLKTPNWVSYQLNKSWIGTDNDRIDSFGSDPRLPFSIQTTGNDIPNTSNYQKGHLTTFSHRSRSRQYKVSTFLMTNVIPQP